MHVINYIGNLSDASRMVSRLKSCVIMYKSSLLKSLCPIQDVDNETKWWLLVVPGTVSFL